MMFSLCYYLSIIIFWGVPISLGAGFWEVTAFYGVITLLVWCANYEY